ncbi:MAG: hypothetical protein ABR922_09200 [Streptosporangiaceae bacterium]
MAKYPDSTKTSLAQRLTARARERWPGLASIAVRHRGAFSYVDGVLADGTTLRLCRLRYIGSAHDWRFAIYRASHDDYDDSIFPTGLPVGTCEDALDVACGLYLADPTAWTRPPTNLRPRPLSVKTNAEAGPQPPELSTRRSRVCCRPAGGCSSAYAGAGKRNVLQPELAACERLAALAGDGDQP